MQLGREMGDHPQCPPRRHRRAGSRARRQADRLVAGSLAAGLCRRQEDLSTTLFDVDLAEVCITSNAMATNEEAPANAFRLNEVPGVAVVVEKAVGTKCARSWKISEPMSAAIPEYPDVIAA